MQRSPQHINIPFEITRTLVTISELGSFSKAGDKLGLSQPAISAQVKRLQMLVGGNVFEKTASGVAFTARGKLILAHAKKLIEANDQILSIGAPATSYSRCAWGFRQHSRINWKDSFTVQVIHQCHIFLRMRRLAHAKLHHFRQSNSAVSAVEFPVEQLSAKAARSSIAGLSCDGAVVVH